MEAATNALAYNCRNPVSVIACGPLRIMVGVRPFGNERISTIQSMQCVFISDVDRTVSFLDTSVRNGLRSRDSILVDLSSQCVLAENILRFRSANWSVVKWQHVPHRTYVSRSLGNYQVAVRWMFIGLWIYFVCRNAIDDRFHDELRLGNYFRSIGCFIRPFRAHQSSPVNSISGNRSTSLWSLVNFYGLCLPQVLEFSPDVYSVVTCRASINKTENRFILDPK